MDGLKKQVQSLTARIEQTKANLAIQSKYRDAATAMSKLYTPAQAKRRTLLLGNRHSVDQTAREAELEKETSEQRCEELAAELFSMEKRVMDIQRRLLQHTAGILQLTHGVSKKKKAMLLGPALNGIPGSPESLYTYSNARNSLEVPGDDFDDRSLYFSQDQPDGFAPLNKSGMGMRPRSPNREEENKLREELETVKRQSAEQLDTIRNAEQSLGDLNDLLRDVVIQINPEKNGNYGPVEPGESISGHLDYISHGLRTIQQTQASAHGKETDTAAASLAEAEGRMESLNRQVFVVVQTFSALHPMPPNYSGSGLEEQFGWLDEALQVLQIEVEKSRASSAGNQQAEQIETVLSGLWDIIQSGYADIQQRKQDRRKTRMDKGISEDDEELSADEDWDVNEPYSLSAFSAKVQSLYAQATSLKDQKSVLKRQIKQQRELNNKSDVEKDQETRTRAEELQRTKDLLDRTETEAKEAQEKLAGALADLDTLQVSTNANETAVISAAKDQLRERDTRIIALESEVRPLQEKLAMLEAQLANINEQLQQAQDSKQKAEDDAQNLQAIMKVKDEELETLNVTMVELKTEMTMAKAELEGAYGSRSQRAAEAAKLTKSEQVQDLHAQVEKLKSELAATLKDFEGMTKETLSSEKERVELESKLDDALSVKTSLESEVGILRNKLDTEMSSLKEQLDAERLKAVPPSPGLNVRAGASMLSDQFRATMKEERKRFQEEIRVSNFP